MKLFGAGDTFDEPALLAPWSIMHFAVGILAYPVLQKVDIDMSRIVLWAILHGLYESKDIFGSYFPSACKWISACDKSFLNSVGDEIMALLGYVLAMKLNITSIWTAGMFVVIALLILGSPLFDEYKKLFPKEQ